MSSQSSPSPLWVVSNIFFEPHNKHVRFITSEDKKLNNFETHWCTLPHTQYEKEDKACYVQPSMN